jgi:hypothetical protein
MLGYRHEAVREPPVVHPKLDIKILARLPGSSIKDVLFVSIDVDTGGGYQVISPEQSFHIGISLFDTRSLTNPMDDPAAAIQSYQYITKESRPCKWAAKHFLFGDTESIQVWTEKPPKPKAAAAAAPKLGIYAKRRLKAAKKTSKRLLQELPFAKELDEQDEHEFA